MTSVFARQKEKSNYLNTSLSSVQIAHSEAKTRIEMLDSEYSSLHSLYTGNY